MFIRVVIGIVALLHVNIVSTERAEMKYPACDEFSKGASFYPAKVVDSSWRIFYYWYKYSELLPIKLALPVEQDIYRYKRAINASGLADIIDWRKAKLVIFPAPTTSIMLIEKEKPTAYEAILLKKPSHWSPNEIQFTEIRMKNVGRYIGMMACHEAAVYALARVNEVPANEDLEKSAATVFKGEGFEFEGHSYLYRPPRDL